jgi:aldehyde dehydrogenase
MMRYAQPGLPGSVVHLSPRYENFIDGKWVPPVKGHYMVNLAPATPHVITRTRAVTGTRAVEGGSS